MKKKTGFFDYDGRLYHIANKIMYLVGTNFLFLLCSVPIVTIGASAAAMNTLLLKFRQGEDVPLIRGFFRAFWENLKPATAVWGGMLAVLLTLWVNLSLLGQWTGSGAAVLRGALALVLLAVLAVGVYVFPAMAYFENTAAGYLQYALASAVARLPQTLLLLGIDLLMVLAVLALLPLLPMAILLVLLCGFSLPAWFSTKILLKQFRPEQPEQYDSMEMI